MIATSSWFAPLPRNHIRIGISRGLPQHAPATHTLRYRPLFPGPWFRSLEPAAFLQRYEALLAALDPVEVVQELQELAGDRIATLTCFETAPRIDAGECWCHRHIVAAWLERALGIEVVEVGHARLDRFAFLRSRQDETPLQFELPVPPRACP
jgi:uncharacterized protein DUF488